MDTLTVDRLDYLQIVDPDSLIPMKQINGPARALVAAWIGKTRLIDNIEI
jgi:pantoate--beta-alanine ligase